MRLQPFFEPLDRFDGLRSDLVYARPEPQPPDNIAASVKLRPLTISGYSFHQQYVILDFAEVPVMNAAELLRGLIVYARKEDLWELEENEFLVHEIEGFSIVDDHTGAELGFLETVDPGGAHDFLKVSCPGKSFLIPFVREFIRKVDTEARQIRVVLPPGIEDL